MSSYIDTYLSFPDQATRISVVPSGSFNNVDEVGLVPTYSGASNIYLINIRLQANESLSSLQQTYVIPPPMYPKRAWFDIMGGTLCLLMFMTLLEMFSKST